MSSLNSVCRYLVKTIPKISNVFQREVSSDLYSKIDKRIDKYGDNFTYGRKTIEAFVLSNGGTTRAGRGAAEGEGVLELARAQRSEGRVQRSVSVLRSDPVPRVGSSEIGFERRHPLHDPIASLVDDRTMLRSQGRSPSSFMMLLLLTMFIALIIG